RRLQFKPLEAGATPRRDQEITAQNSGRFIIVDDDLDLAVLLSDARHRDALANHHAVMAQLIEHDARAFAVGSTQRRAGFEHGDLRAKAAKCLRELEPDRAGADDDEMLRAALQVEDGLVRKIWSRRETVDVRK